ncbi:hypothetical protein HN803_02470 [candidate division WWE3 bacterium]|jgi:hypothetical protein|nr:hypothetical protein [candidate division WWE3 bacterium]
MFLFILGIILMLGAAIVLSFSSQNELVQEVGQKVKYTAGTILLIIGLGISVWSTTIYVEDNQGGLVVVKFGANLVDGDIIANNGEKGPQADVLPPGWHFFYWPWIYELTPVDNKEIRQGYVGVVTAKDGKPLDEGDVFAPKWVSAIDMIDAKKFLTGDGRRGPQLTILTPGQYRYNSRLFTIEERKALDVEVGTVAVIKANAGPKYEPTEGKTLTVVNGVEIVPNGNSGIWEKALTPNKYYMHPDAFDVIFLATTKRVYSYTGTGTVSVKSDRPTENNSIEVRTMDGYDFPVDVRVSVKIDALNAPYVVALLKDPDADADKDGFDILEEKAVLPSLRSIFRNSAEDKGAIEYVQSRSEIEKSATTKFKADMEIFKIDVDKVYIADIGLKDTPEGKALLETQTNKELALQQKEMYKEQVLAAAEEAKQIEAAEQAVQKKNIVESAAQIEIEKNKALARAATAVGEAEYNAKVIESLGGVDNYVLLECVDKFSTAWQLGGSNVPSVISVGGGSSGMLQSFIATMLRDAVKPAPAPVKK